LLQVEFRRRPVGLSVGLSVGNDREFSTTADSAEMPFGMIGRADPDGRAHWRHLANTVARLSAAAMA